MRLVSQPRGIRQIILIWTTLVCGLLSLQGQSPGEYQVKAAYLYSFGKFVSWPAENSDAFLLCILGDDPFGPALEHTISNTTVNGKPVAAKRISTTQDAAGCRIVFVASSESRFLARDLASLPMGVLTVSDIENFSQSGGMIQFVNDNSRIRFEVNLTAAQGSGLHLSSELLKVATRVKGAPQNSR